MVHMSDGNMLMSKPLTFNQVMLSIHDVPDGVKVAYMD